MSSLTIGFEVSQSESNAFGMRVGRVKLVGHESYEDCVRLAQTRDFDFVIVDVVELSATFQLALEHNHWLVRSAGTIVEWSISASDLETQKKYLSLRSVSEYKFVLQEAPVSRDEIPIISETTRVIFDCYPNHYLFSPELGRVNSGDAFANQVENCLLQLGYQGSFVEYEGTQIAMALTKISDNALEIILAGVIAPFRSRGVYQFLISNLAAYAKERGLKLVKITTQSENLKVQQRWVDFGFKPTGSVRRLHALKMPESDFS